MSRREYLLWLYGPGVRPCLDGASNWLGCTWCYKPCILYPGGAEEHRRKMGLPPPEHPVIPRASRGWHAYPEAGGRESPKKAVS